jgi:putative phosphoribosyl transferase
MLMRRLTLVAVETVALSDSESVRSRIARRRLDETPKRENTLMAGWSGLARRSARQTFRDRREAGQVLAQALAAYQGRDDLLVLGLARGGVPVGWEVAAALGAPLDVFLVRKLGVPQWEELAMGALAVAGALV